MIKLGDHLHDDHLNECYLIERSGEQLDPRDADHLAECSACHDRYDSFADFMDEVREAGTAEADAVFGDDRLAEQHASIIRRLESLTGHGRVISFPGHAPQQVAQTPTRIASRWLVASAAAGLIVGIGLGGMIASPAKTGAPATARTAYPAPGATQPAVRTSISAPAVDSLDDDRFLRDLEVALSRPHTRELLPIDAWTPHVREIGRR